MNDAVNKAGFSNNILNVSISCCAGGNESHYRNEYHGNFLNEHMKISGVIIAVLSERHIYYACSSVLPQPWRRRNYGNDADGHWLMRPLLSYVLRIGDETNESNDSIVNAGRRHFCYCAWYEIRALGFIIIRFWWLGVIWWAAARYFRHRWNAGSMFDITLMYARPGAYACLSEYAVFII